MKSSPKLSRLVLGAFLATSLWACRAPKGDVANPTGHSPHHSQTSAGAAKAQVPAANRDPLGVANVDEYIARLASADRIAEMRPDEVVEFLNVKPDAWIADLGCGPGIFATRLARAAPAGVVFGVDVEPRQLDALRQAIAEQNLENVVPVLASMDDAHLPKGRFDLLFLADTYHHLSGRVAYMKALRASLRPGGKLAVFEYKPGDLPVGPPADHKLKAGELERELEAAGWSLETEISSHKYHDFQIWVPR